MKKGLYIFFSALWLLSFAALGVYYVGFAPRESSYDETENRMLSAAPDFSPSNVLAGGVGEETENYLTDNIFLRRELISLRSKFMDIGSFATYEDSLAVLDGGEDRLSSSELDPGALDDMAGALLSPSPAPEETPLPSSEPSPVMTEKPAADPKDYGDFLNVTTQNGEKVITFYNYGKTNVLALTSVLNRVAALLPEDGRLVYTMVPQSRVGNVYVSAEDKRGFISEAEPMVDAFGAKNVGAVSSAAILGEAIERGEYVYFRTDMHWTPYGTWLVYSELLRRAGQEPAAWEDFDLTVEEPFYGTYYRDNPTSYMYDNPDRLDLLSPKFPLEWRRITGPDSYDVIPFLNFNALANDRYTVYLGGPAGPWTYAQCDNGIERRCLVITDSFGLAFVPLVTANYGQVHYYDPRYFNQNTVGCTVAEMLEKYDISDVYVVVGDLHSYNSDFILQQLSGQLGDQ